MGISRQAYYQAHDRAKVLQQREAETLLRVHDIRREQPRLGTRKLHVLIRASQVQPLGRDALFNLLRHHRLLVLPQRSYHKTTFSHHRFHRHPNLLKAGPEQIIPQAPEQVWVSDITYIPTTEVPTYLSLVTDASIATAHGATRGQALLQSLPHPPRSSTDTRHASASLWNLTDAQTT